MSQNNEDFFIKKKIWSQVKDELLGCYLVPYLQKVLYTGRPIIYVDCFAGKGKFDDGKPGSPQIALEIIKNCQEHSKKKDISIFPYFIDLNYAEDLKKNLAKYNLPTQNIISGKYEHNIQQILNVNQNNNIFLYIDPYGIKALNHKLFDSFIVNNEFYSVELLINLNSYGFIREGCRVLGVKFDEEYIMDDLIEYESTKLEKNQKSANILNEIAGGDYWQEIIMKKNRGLIDTKQAETEFSESYCKRLREHYKYVLNMPLRIKEGQNPKYRMVHATNHVEGCILMVNNICNRWELMKQIQTGPQLTLFDEDINNNIIDQNDLVHSFKNHIKDYTDWRRLKEIMADFYMKYGPICKTSDITMVVKKLLSDNLIDIKRQPEYTTTGKPSVFFSDEGKNKVYIRWKK